MVRVIAFGAHPDYCEYVAAGVAAKWSALGRKVKFVAATNGDIGHWQTAGGPLAQRRAAEAKRSAEILGIEGVTLDLHDGELMPTLENRRTIVRLIRDWKADVVLAHRPNDYHPDHRYTGILVQDAAYMVTVPFFCPDTPSLTKNPVFLYYEDTFLKPAPFAPDIVVSIDDVIEKKLDALCSMESQFYEGGCEGNASTVPASQAGQSRRRREVREKFRSHCAIRADKYRKQLVDIYGKKGKSIKFAEAFEVCEYGRRPDAKELRQMFPV